VRLHARTLRKTPWPASGNGNVEESGKVSADSWKVASVKKNTRAACSARQLVCDADSRPQSRIFRRFAAIANGDLTGRFRVATFADPPEGNCKKGRGLLFINVSNRA